MEPIRKKTEEMIAALAGSALEPDKISDLAANFLKAMDNPANQHEEANSADLVSPQAREQK